MPDMLITDVVYGFSTVVVFSKVHRTGHPYHVSNVKILLLSLRKTAARAE